jgi:hypothetical protein
VTAVAVSEDGKKNVVGAGPGKLLTENNGEKLCVAVTDTYLKTRVSGGVPTLHVPEEQLTEVPLAQVQTGETPGVTGEHVPLIKASPR